MQHQPVTGNGSAASKNSNVASPPRCPPISSASSDTIRFRPITTRPWTRVLWQNRRLQQNFHPCQKVSQQPRAQQDFSKAFALGTVGT